MMPWQAYTGPAQLVEGKDGLLMRLGTETVGPTRHLAGLGFISFALGLRSSVVFRHSRPDTPAWEVRRYGAFVQREGAQALAPIERGRREAQQLMPPCSFADIEARFEARMALVLQQRSMQGLLERAAERHREGQLRPVQPLDGVERPAPKQLRVHGRGET